MSLLGTPVYANPSTPLWASSSGGTITGNVTVQSLNTTGSQGVAVLDASGNDALRMVTQGGNSYIQTPYPLLFTKIGASAANTSLTLSVAGANTDVLTVGGRVNARTLGMPGSGPGIAIGTITLVAGLSAIISTTAMDGVNSFIYLTRWSVNGSTVLGELRVKQKNVGSFVIEATQTANPLLTETGDLSDVQYVIINAT